jgi:glycerol-3-phosphate O-acyltransferase / dihydroxyacetone phosphate acyltransferase
MIARVLATASRLLLGIFYRRVDVVGLTHVPPKGPVVVVANHHNALVDPLLLLASLPRTLRPVAKAPLFRHPILGGLLRLVGAIPVHRRHESEGGPDRNAAAFARASEFLAAGDGIVLFPEGVSQPEPVLMPLRTGAARLVLGAEQLRGGALGVTLLPVGLVYEEPGTFRIGRALVVVGEPIATGDLVAQYATDPSGAVRALTDRIAGALRSLVVEAEDRRTLQLMSALDRLMDPRPEGGPAARAAWMRGVMTAYRTLRREAPTRIARFREDLERYEMERERAGVGDSPIARYGAAQVTRYVFREGASLVLGAPLALWGLCVHGVPYHLTGLAVRTLSPEEDMIATDKLATGMLLYPLCWMAEAWIVTRLGGRLALAWFFIALLPTGFLALTWQARLTRFRAQALGFLAFVFRPDLHRRLVAQRDALRAELDALSRMATPAAALESRS